MKIIIIFLINFLCMSLFESGCVSTNAVSGSDQKVSSNNLEISPTSKGMQAGTMTKQLELRLSAGSEICTKSASCKVLLNLKNTTNEDVTTEVALVVALEQHSSAAARDFSRDLNSPLDITTLENLQPNEYRRLFIPSNRQIEIEIDLERIKWLKSIQSSWDYRELWEHSIQGPFQVYAGLAVNPKLIDSSQIKEDLAAKKAAGGGDEVTFVNIPSTLCDPSNVLTIDFRRK